jgi:peptidoglycan/LPS O-acetylase OafA/YrhL
MAARAAVAPPSVGVQLEPPDTRASEKRTVRGEAVRRFYAPELDCLRFVAFLAVFFFHARDYPLSASLPYSAANFIHSFETAGSFGVDLFFVLSAYLITELLLREQTASGKIDVKAFYLRRILRIWPLYFFFILLTVCLSHIDHSQQFGWKYILGFSLLSGNWMAVLFGVPQCVANPLWSVSLEEQFYLCWPPLVRWMSGKNLAAAAMIMLLLSNLSRLFLFAFAHPKNATIWFDTFTRLDPIALGILLAVLLRAHPVRLNNVDRILLTLAAAGLLLAVSEHAHLNWNGARLSVVGLLGYPVVALGCFAVVLATLGAKNAVVRQPGLIYLGKISYGLYVFHPLAQWATERFFSAPARHLWPGFYPFIALVLNIALAAVSYRFLESPFLRWKKSFTHVPSRPV